MGSIIGIPTTRVSDLFVRQRLTNQLQADQLDMFRLQMQLSTGRRFQVPSEDANAALRVMNLQRLLERKDQVQNNLVTNQAYMVATDTALSSVSGNLAEVRAVALGVLGTIATDVQRSAASQQFRELIRQLQDVGNQKFRGRYIFAGSDTTVRPFGETDAAFVQYLGDEGRLQSYSDIDLLFETNLNGNEVFGAISEPVRGSEDLNPLLTFDTRLADLRGGVGITRGSIAISSNGQTSTVDISNAETIGDVAALIRSHAPEGAPLNVELTPSGLIVELDPLVTPPGQTLTIREVGGGTTASELGILAQSGTSDPIGGGDLDPILRRTTRLVDILGARATAVVRSVGGDNNFIVEADTAGQDLNGVTVVLVDDGTIKAGFETVVYDAAGATLTVSIESDRSTAAQVVLALENAHELEVSPFTARLDPLDEQFGGRGHVGASSTTVTKYGAASGAVAQLDQSSGLQIVNGGETHVVAFDSAETIEDLLNTLNMSGAGVLAEINETATGINVRSRLSGADFMIGENGGATATQLGIRTFSENLRLEDLNFGFGVPTYDEERQNASVAVQPAGANNNLTFTARYTGAQWNGVSIRFEQQVPAGDPTLDYDPLTKTMVFKVDPDATTANDVVDLLRNTPGANDDFEISLATDDGGNNDGTGLVGADRAADAAQAWAGLNNDLIFQARNAGTDWNGFSFEFQGGAPPGTETLLYDRDAKLMQFTIDPASTTAADILLLWQADPDASADFLITLDDAIDTPNDGTGFLGPIVGVIASLTTGGTSAAPAITAGGETGGVDFTITQADATIREVDVSDCETIGDVLRLLNSVGQGTLEARLDTFGNGIELVDYTTGNNKLAVSRTQMSTAAIGLGLVSKGQTTNVAATPGMLAGADVAPLETKGVFTALLRIRRALEMNDQLEAQRGIDLLDQQIISVNFARAGLGARQQGLDITQDRLDSEEIDLREILSKDFDVDMVAAISAFSGRQASFQASLQTTAQIFAMSLLDYI